MGRVLVRAHQVLREQGGVLELALELAFPRPAAARALSLLG
jgi:hypothetical protein